MCSSYLLDMSCEAIVLMGQSANSTDAWLIWPFQNQNELLSHLFLILF